MSDAKFFYIIPEILMLIKSNSCIYPDHSCPLHKSSLNPPTRPAREGCNTSTQATHVSTHSPTPGICDYNLWNSFTDSVHCGYLDSGNRGINCCPCLADTSNHFKTASSQSDRSKSTLTCWSEGHRGWLLRVDRVRWPIILLGSKLMKTHEGKGENNKA